MGAEGDCRRSRCRLTGVKSTDRKAPQRPRAEAHSSINDPRETFRSVASGIEVDEGRRGQVARSDRVSEGQT